VEGTNAVYTTPQNSDLERAYGHSRNFVHRLRIARFSRYLAAISGQLTTVFRNSQRKLQNYVEAPFGSFVRVRSSAARQFYRCLISGCKGEGQTLRAISTHYDLEHSSGRLLCPVPNCGATLADQRYLALHTAAEHEGQRPFPCTITGCKWSGKYEEHRKKHLRDAHSAHFFHKCEICHKAFSSRQAKNVHVQEQHYSRQYACEFCEDICETEEVYFEHLQNRHPRERPHACPVLGCFRTYKQADQLDVHVRSVHEGESFVCGRDGCGLDFSTEGARQFHIKEAHDLSRIKNNRYTCKFCKQAFSTIVVKQLHEEGAPSTCQKLQKARSTVNDAEARPLVCPGCAKRFTQPGTLNRHMKAAKKGSKKLRCMLNPQFSSSSSDTSGNEKEEEEEDSSDADQGSKAFHSSAKRTSHGPNSRKRKK
jgi:hypothetical protein